MHTQCSSKLLEFQDHGRRRLVAKKLIFLLVFLRVPSWFISGRLPRCPAEGRTEWNLKKCQSDPEGRADRS